jgi:hypothetical protein
VILELNDSKKKKKKELIFENDLKEFIFTVNSATISPISLS